MEFCFNPIQNKVPQGPCLAGSNVTYTLRIARHVHCENVFLVLINDKTSKVTKTRIPIRSCDENYYTFELTLLYPSSGLFWYYFEIKNKGGSFYLCKTPLFEVEPVPDVRASFAQIVYDKNLKSNNDFKSGIIYHIFVDRFKKSGKVISKEGMLLRNDWGGEVAKNSDNFLIINQECFGGNIQGIIDKLAYIKSLGTTTIFLSPIFESFSYHKYDIADYEQVDSMFGGWAAFERLVSEANKYGMKILLDGVFNHVGSDSVYFNKLGRFNSVGAYQSKKSPYYDWFTFEHFPDKYSAWWGIDTLPQFNETNKQMQQYIAGKDGIIDKYMQAGILGFRLDVVDEITDEFLDKICKRTRQNQSSALILGEVWEDAATKTAYNQRRSYFSGNQLNSVMNYPLKNAIINFVTKGNAEDLASTFFMLKDHYPVFAQHNAMNFLGTHDTKRILSVLKESNSKSALQLLKIAGTIQYCAPGVPTVFYGDEIGLQGGEAPFCRVCYPWGQESAENKEILNWYKKLGKIRGESVFVDGNCNVLLSHNGVFIFERKNKDTRIIVAANCGPDVFQLNIGASMTNLDTLKPVKECVMLSPFDFVILKEKR